MGGGCDGQDAAVEDVAAAVPGDQGGEAGVGAAVAALTEDAGRGALACPVPGGQAGAGGEPGGGGGVAAGQPLVQEPEGDADAAGDGGGRAIRGFGLGLVQDRGGLRAVAGGDRRGGGPHGAGGQFAGVPGGGEPGHIVPFDGADQCPQRGRVRQVQAGGADPVLGQQRREVAEQPGGQAGAEP